MALNDYPGDDEPTLKRLHPDLRAPREPLPWLLIAQLVMALFILAAAAREWWLR